MNKVNVPISEYDIELFRDLVNFGDEFDWTFKSENGEEININFIKGEENE